MCMQQNCTYSIGFLYEMITEEMWTPWKAMVEYFDYTPWLFSLLGSTLIGLTGIFPLFIIPIEEGANLRTGGNIFLQWHVIDPLFPLLSCYFLS